MGQVRGQMAMQESGPELEQPMQPQYIRCNKGHIDLWYDNSEGEECPLCEVIGRGWGKPKRK
jgi:hypothetical protein